MSFNREDLIRYPIEKAHTDPFNEQFINDNEANLMLSPPKRFPFRTDYISLSKFI